MSAIAAVARARSIPSSNHQMGVFVTPLLESVAGGIRPTLRRAGRRGQRAAADRVLQRREPAARARRRAASARPRFGRRSAPAGGGSIRLFVVEGLDPRRRRRALAGLILAAWGVRAAARRARLRAAARVGSRDRSSRARLRRVCSPSSTAVLFCARAGAAPVAGRSDAGPAAGTAHAETARRGRRGCGRCSSRSRWASSSSCSPARP